MSLEDYWIIPYLETVKLHHLVILKNHWFKLNELFISAFVDRWYFEKYIFYMLFGECTITLQDVAYQIGLLIDGDYYVSGCLTNFEKFIEGANLFGRYLVCYLL
ncbi:hypothetical protein Ahy_B03g066886 [Arachis hypogaea]|uniref:Aminotransferase-like plant mobile domain-containing protein n=1 Tax=Arachis hypogaea TaxID=3818 RepID=A0A445A5F0_ARAHY|nr:hypothetical protein Ahy_B03g066886 [Arachis hypogaea]